VDSFIPILTRTSLHTIDHVGKTVTWGRPMDTRFYFGRA